MSSSTPDDATLLAGAYKAERELNSNQAKTGKDMSNSATVGGEDGVNTDVESKFPGAKVTVGSAASGGGDNREIPVEEGGDIKANGQPTKAKDFEGVGGPEDKEALDRDNAGGDNDVKMRTARTTQ